MSADDLPADSSLDDVLAAYRRLRDENIVTRRQLRVAVQALHTIVGLRPAPLLDKKEETVHYLKADALLKQAVAVADRGIASVATLITVEDT